MLAPGLRINLEPDYTQSISEVYRKLFVLSVERFQVLDLLTSCEYHHGSAENLTMPSWVPDWSSPKLAVTLTHTRTASSSNSEIAFPGTKIMAATGLPVSTINQLHCINISRYPSYKEIISTIRKMATVLGVEVNSSSSESSGYFDSFTRTVVTNMFSDRSNPLLDYLPHSKDGCGAVYWALKANLGDMSEPPANFARYFALVPFWLRGRSLFMAEGGRFGLVPQGAQRGDSLVVLLGCPSPMVLRPSADGRFQVIGEAFCYDLANGEALLGQLPEHVGASFRLFQGARMWAFINHETSEFLEEDPRLGPLSAGWLSELEGIRTPYSWFWNNKIRVQPSVHDPRLTPEALRKRGVPLRTFELI